MDKDNVKMLLGVLGILALTITVICVYMSGFSAGYDNGWVEGSKHEAKITNTSK